LIARAADGGMIGAAAIWLADAPVTGGSSSLFDRFSAQARQVVVLAAEEARSLGHDHIGTEHILLGLIREGDGVAAAALGALGITLRAGADLGAVTRSAAGYRGQH
jgi:hypothetical protein